MHINVVCLRNLSFAVNIQMVSKLPMNPAITMIEHRTKVAQWYKLLKPHVNKSKSDMMLVLDVFPLVPFCTMVDSILLIAIVCQENSSVCDKNKFGIY